MWDICVLCNCSSNSIVIEYFNVKLRKIVIQNILKSLENVKRAEGISHSKGLWSTIVQKGFKSKSTSLLAFPKVLYRRLSNNASVKSRTKFDIQWASSILRPNRIQCNDILTAHQFLYHRQCFQSSHKTFFKFKYKILVQFKCPLIIQFLVKT